MRRIPAPITPDTRQTVIARIVSRKTELSDFGPRSRMLVEIVEDEGAWRAYGSVPKSLADAQIGAVVTFEAKFKRSANDATFARFNRPTKGELIRAE